jgi:polyisoprenoid-binding protein YceI
MIGMFRACTFRRASLALVPSLLMAAGVVVSADSGVRAQEATPAPVGVMQSADGLAECGASEIGSLPADVDAATIYTIVPEESAARYRSQEELAEVGANEAVGETQAIAGQIGFDANGMPLPCSRFDVDLRTLKSDEARRDNYLYKNTLQTEQYPLATFVLRGVEGMNGPLVDGQATPVILKGDLTLRDVTKPVAWQADVTLTGDTLTGNAATSFTMQDFNIEKPSVPLVLSLDDTLKLEIDLTARPQS